MKPLALVLFAVSLSLALAACGGDDGAKSAGPSPSVTVETAPPATSHGGTLATPPEDHFAQIVEYVAQADAICTTAIRKFEATKQELPWGIDMTVFDHPLELDGLAVELSEEALVQLRALPPAEFGFVNPVALCSHRGRLQESASGPTRAEFVAQANEICLAANSRTNPDGWVSGGYESTARIAEEALAQLRALTPEADRALLEVGFYQVVEQEIYAFREANAAAAAGDIVRWFLLSGERVNLTHQMESFTGAYGLSGCGVVLGGS